MAFNYKLLFRVLALVLSALQRLPADTDHCGIAGIASEILTIIAGIPLPIPDDPPDPPQPMR